MTIAQVLGGGYSIVQWVIIAIVVISVIGILYVVAQANNISIPPWAVRIFWIVTVAIVSIFAIKLIMGMI
jgi:hypothetical protein